MGDTNMNHDVGLDLDDSDRLPWLETADGYEYDSTASPLKIASFVLGGLLLLALIAGGIYWVQNRPASGGSGNGELIVAEKGNYKVRPEEAGGKSFEGEGDAAFAASEGQQTGSRMAHAEPGEAPGEVETISPAATPLVTPKAGGPAPAGSAFVQLGAFGDSATADQAWAALGQRFGFLSGVSRRIAEGKSEGGRKVYRLQAIQPNSAAALQLCAKLKAAGENCLIVK